MMMSSENTLSLPVIDFSKHDLKPGTPEWNIVKLQVRQAVEQYGCFKASFDKILELRKPLFGALEELFDLPLQTKELVVSEKLFRGYLGSRAPWYESMVIDDANVTECIEKDLTNILWPQGNPSFSKTVLSYWQLASGLERTIRRMILESFGLEKYMDDHIDFTNYYLRLMKYVGRPQTQEMPATSSHTDKNMVTLLYPNDVNGLRIQTKDGEWINVNPSPDTFIVLIGESLTIWLNGRLSAPYHRVCVEENKTRYCVGLFAAPKGGYKVKVPQELVDEDNTLLFKPFDYEDFLGFFYSELARGVVDVPLQAYCSV